MRVLKLSEVYLLDWLIVANICNLVSNGNKKSLLKLHLL